MKKKFLGLLLVLAVVFSAYAQHDDERFFQVEPIPGGMRIIGYNGPGGAVRIPASIRGQSVTEIGTAVFWRKGLTSVTIPNTMIVIGDGAFNEN